MFIVILEPRSGSHGGQNQSGHAEERRRIARELHDSGGAVRVQVTAGESIVVLTVKDFGVGVAQDVLDRLWKPGTVGAGLAGLRERLKGLGGFLEIESNPGGTLLKATIPVLQTDGIETDDGSVPLPSAGHAPALPVDS